MSALEPKKQGRHQMPRFAPAIPLAAPKTTPVQRPTPVPKPPIPTPLSKPTPTTHGAKPLRDEMKRLGHFVSRLAGDGLKRVGGVDVEPTSTPVPKPPPPVPLSQPAPASLEVRALSPDQRWGTDKDWPEEWSKSSRTPISGAEAKPTKSSKPTQN